MKQTYGMDPDLNLRQMACERFLNKLVQNYLESAATIRSTKEGLAQIMVMGFGERKP